MTETPASTDEMTWEDREAAAVAAVQCPDCLVPAGTPCAGYLGTHADRVRLHYLRTLEHGTCALCGQPMVRGRDPLDAWHHNTDDALRCPVLPNPLQDWNAYAAKINAGVSPGHPGLEHFIPAEPQEEPVTGGLIAALSGAIDRAREDRRLDAQIDALHGEGAAAAIDAAIADGSIFGEDPRPDRLCPECAQGKCPNCTKDVLTDDDTLEPCLHVAEKVHP